MNNNELTIKTIEMPFKPGKSGNPSGRPKGSYTKPIRSKLEGLLAKTFPVIEVEIETATPDARREFFTDIAGIVLPQKHKTA